MLKYANMQENTDAKPIKIKVLYMITKGVWGGAAEYVYTLATSLPTNMYDVTVLCGDGRALPEKLEAAGVRVYSVPTLMRDVSLSQEIKSFFALIQIIRHVRPDVLHLNSPKAGGLGSLAGRIARVKKILYTAHGWPMNEPRGTVSKAVITLFSWMTIQFCHKTIVIAEREKKQALRMFWVNPKKIVLVRNGVEKFDMLGKTESHAELTSRLHLPAETTSRKTLWLGTIAELHRNKGLEYALEAVSRLTVPFIYIIFGEGEDRKKLEKIISHYKLENRVILAGFTSNARIFLPAFDIFLLPSVKEGLPYAVLEAGLAHCAVVASKIGGIPDIIENNTMGILVTPAKSTEITRAIEYLIDNPDTRKEYGKHLKEKVAKEFSAKEMVENTMRVYTQ